MLKESKRFVITAVMLALVLYAIGMAYFYFSPDPTLPSLEEAQENEIPFPDEFPPAEQPLTDAASPETAIE
jgi:hypothetical protein